MNDKVWFLNYWLRTLGSIYCKYNNCVLRYIIDLTSDCSCNCERCKVKYKDDIEREIKYYE